jgi:Transposase
MEQSGRKPWQLVANPVAPKTARTSQIRCIGCDQLPATIDGKEGHEEGPPPVTGSGLSSGAIERRPEFEVYAGLDLSRKRLDFNLLDADGATIEVGAAPPDADGLRGLSERLAGHGAPIRAAIESMNGARFVHDRLELAGWQVEIADAQKVKGLAPLACNTDRIDARVLAELARRDLVNPGASHRLGT